MKKKRTLVFALIALAVLLVFTPLFLLQGANFGGTDEQGSAVVEEIAGEGFVPWFEPVIENLTGGELSAGTETLIFCIQTGIGVGILAYCFGYLVARKIYSREDGEGAEDTENTGNTGNTESIKNTESKNKAPVPLETRVPGA
jgi:cobalt/nickel transport protein